MIQWFKTPNVYYYVRDRHVWGTYSVWIRLIIIEMPSLYYMQCDTYDATINTADIYTCKLLD